MSVYGEIADQLRKRIKLGILSPGQQLEKEIDFAKSLSVTRKTLRSAFALLEGEGLIVRRKRAGTFIAENADKLVRAEFDICVMGDYRNSVNTNIFLSNESESKDSVESSIAVRSLLAEDIRVKLVSSCGITRIPEGMDGFIIVDALHSSAILELLADSAVPHVAFESHFEYPGVNTVMADDQGAVKECVKTLYENGHRKIAFQGGMIKELALNTGIRRRTEAFQDACAELGLESERWIYNFDESYEGVPDFEILTSRIVSESSAFTAVVCALGNGALAMLDACEANDVNIPIDMEIVCVDTSGFDIDKKGVDKLRGIPGLSKQREKIAAEGIRRLFEWIGRGDYRAECHKLPFVANDAFLSLKRGC
jgi:DNA-binding transcriptional regulator YhcF (GntR family)